jgi:hypothetical protein
MNAHKDFMMGLLEVRGFGVWCEEHFKAGEDYTSLNLVSISRIDSLKIYSKGYSLPHIKIYSKKVDTAAAQNGLEAEDEADDEATTSSHGGDGPTLPPWQ